MSGSKPRLGLVGPLPPPAGGMANQIRQLAELLRAEGMEVVLVRTNRPYRPQWIGGIRGLRALFRLVPYLFSIDRACARVDVIHLLANSGWAWHLFSAPVVWIAKWRGVPVIVNYRGGDADRFLTNGPSWVKSTIRSASACVVPSGFLRSLFERHGIASTIIPNIVDLKLFRPRSRPAATRRNHIVITRNLETIYGIDDALRAFRLIAERHEAARLTIAGDGPERERLMRLAADLGIGDKVRLTGRLTKEEIASLYQEADIMLNPSRIDNMPNAILEAYACAIPVVSTNAGGIPFVARDGETALLVDVGDSSAMAERVCTLIEDDELALRLAQNGLREAGQYRWEVVRDQWLQLYEALTPLDGVTERV